MSAPGPGAARGCGPDGRIPPLPARWPVRPARRPPTCAPRTPRARGCLECRRCRAPGVRRAVPGTRRGREHLSERDGGGQRHRIVGPGDAQRPEGGGGEPPGTTTEDTSAATRPELTVRNVPVRSCPCVPGLARSSRHSAAVSRRSSRPVSSMQTCSPASSSKRTVAGPVPPASSAATEAAVGAASACGPGGGASWSTVWVIAPSFAALPRCGCTRIRRISLISPHSRSLRAGSVSGSRSHASESCISRK